MIEKLDASASKETKTMYFSKHLLVLACFPYRPHLRNSERWLEGVTKATIGVGFILGACTWTLRNTFSSLSSAFSAPCKSPLGKGSWVFLERLHPVLFQNNKDVRSSKKKTSTKSARKWNAQPVWHPHDLINFQPRIPTPNPPNNPFPHLQLDDPCQSFQKCQWVYQLLSHPGRHTSHRVHCPLWRSMNASALDTNASPRSCPSLPRVMHSMPRQPRGKTRSIGNKHAKA